MGRTACSKEANDVTAGRPGHVLGKRECTAGMHEGKERAYLWSLFQRCLGGLAGLEFCQGESLQLRISDCPVGTLAGKKRHIETERRREGDERNFHGQR